MSFSWKSLLSSGGGGGGQSSSNPANSSSSSNQENANQSIQDVLNSWELQPEGLPPLLGMDNFGNTCYVNSVLQALYFCRPFRESIMSYPSSQSQIVTPQVKGVSTAPNSPLSLNTKNLPMERTPADLTSTPQSIKSSNSTTPHVAPSARGGRAAAVRPSTASSTSSPSVPLLKNNSKSKKDSENSESSGHKRRASLNAMAKGFSSARPPSSGGRSSGTAPKSPILNSTAADASFSTPSTTSASTSPSTVATSATSTSTLPPSSSSSTANPQPKEQDTLFSTLRDLFHLIHDSASQPVATPTNATTILSSQKSNGGRPATASGRLGGSNNTSSLSPSNSTTATASRPGLISADPPVGAGTPHASRGGKNVATGKVPSDSVRRFWSALKKENILFDSTMHQDAHEMLNFVLNKVGEDLIEEERERKKDLSFEENQVQNQNQKRVHQVESGGKTWVHRLFEGVLTNETRCLTCESVTSRDEAFLDLSIDIVQNSSVSSCLRQFSASEMLCSKNKFFCDTCSGLQEAEKRMKIKKLPNVLALHLKRFKYEEEVQRFVKLAYRVVFPFELRLFNTSDDAENPDRLYELFGIVIHVGVGYHHGHYITIVKVGGRWVVFDDTNVGFIEENDIARYFGDSPGSGSAYVLFYQAVDLDHESLGLARPIPAYATATNPRFDAAVPQQVPSSPLESMAPDRVSSPAPMDIPSSKLQARNNIPIPVSAGSSTGLSSSSGSSGGGLFGRRQGSTSVAGLSGDERLDPEKLSSPSGGGGGGGWFGSFRGGNRERRATGSSSAAPASSSSEAFHAPSSYRPITTTNSGSGSATGETDDGLSLSTSSKTTDSTQADKFIGSDLASSPASSAPPLPLPPVSTEPSLPPAEDLTPRPAAAQASTNVNGAEAEVLRTPTATFSDLPAMTDEPQQLPQESGSRNGVGIGNASEPLISGGGGGGGGAQSRFVSAPVTSSPSQGIATGASFAPADRPLTRKEQEKIAKKSRRASAHSSSNFNPYSTSNLPPSPSVGNAGASDEGLGHFSPPTNTKRHSMRRAFGLKKKS